MGDPVTEPIAVPTRPLNIVVPAPGLSTMTPTPPPAAAQQALLKHKDSVEILLDGMTDQRLERTRTTPQSDGQASAAYHSAHTPPASERAPNDDVPKVLLDRPLTPTAVSPRPSPAPGRSYSSDATVLVVPERLGRRLVVAVVLGLLVAAVVLLLLEMSGRRPAPSVAPSETPRPSTTASAGASVVVAPGPVSTAPTPSPPMSAAEAASTSPPAVASSISTRGRVETAPGQPTKRRPKAGPASSGDFGEFRTNF